MSQDGPDPDHPDELSSGETKPLFRKRARKGRTSKRLRGEKPADPPFVVRGSTVETPEGFKLRF